MNRLKGPPVTVTLRIPGNWQHPGELIERLPAGFRLTPEALILPGGERLEFTPVAPDDEFAGVFRSACRQPATDEELAIVDGYTVNVVLHGPGGSMQAARTMMQAGAAIVRAGAAGVFIDNSALAHGGENWIAMTEDGGPDAVSFAFAAIVRGKREVWTMGMHVMGLRDIVMKCADLNDDADELIELIRYMCEGDKPIDDGHILADLHGPRYQAFAEPSTEMPQGSPLHNPFGRLKLVSVREIAEGN
jgi:hypothetical protein